MISKRQYKILSFFLTRSMFFGLGISKILELSKTDSYIAGILGTIIGLGIISLIYFLKKKFELFNHLNSGFSAFIIKIFLFMFASFCLHDVIISLTTLASSFLLPLTPPIIIGSTIIIMIVYGVAKKVNFVKVAEILLPISVAIFLIKVISCFLITDYHNFLPILYTPKLDLLKASLYFAIFSSGSQLLLLIFKDVNLTYKEYVSGYLWGCFTIALTILLISGVLGSTLASILRYPEYIVLKKIKIAKFIENIENFLVFTWLFDLTILGLVCAYNIKELFKLQFKKNKLYKIPYLLWLITILLIGVFVFTKNYAYTLYLYKYDIFIIGAFIIILISTIALRKTLVKKNC